VPDATAAAALALALMLVEELGMALLELDVKDGAAWAAAPASCEKRHDAPHRQPAELPKNRHRLGAAAKSLALDGPVSFSDPESAKHSSSRRGWVERRETRFARPSELCEIKNNFMFQRLVGSLAHNHEGCRMHAAHPHAPAGRLGRLLR
jgi:hypothetical protein